MCIKNDHTCSWINDLPLRTNIKSISYNEPYVENSICNVPVWLLSAYFAMIMLFNMIYQIIT